MKLATDEKILKTYNYATVGKVSDTLTITNKRAILSTEGKLSDGSKVHTTDEMMLESIERVSGALATKRNMLFIVLAVILAALSIVLFAAAEAGVVSFLPLVVAAIFVAVYFLNKKRSFYLVLTSRIREGMDISVAVGNWQRKKTNKAIKVKVDEAVASEIIDEIGSIIVEAKN